MASLKQSEDSSRRRLRTSARANNINYSERNEDFSKPSEGENVSAKKLKRNKRSHLKNTEDIVPEFDEHLHRQIIVDKATDNGTKLFPIFSSIPGLKSQPNLPACEEDGNSEEISDQSTNVTQKEIAPFDKNNPKKVAEKNEEVETTTHHERKGRKSKRAASKVTEMPVIVDKQLISEEMSTKKLPVNEISKESQSVDENGKAEQKNENVAKNVQTNENVLQIFQTNENVSKNVKKNKNVSANENRKKSNTKTDIPINSDETVSEFPVPKAVNTKKQSIAEFFKKVENKDVKNNDSTSKLFPIFNSSPMRQNIKPANIFSPNVKEILTKKRKIDKLVEPTEKPATDMEADLSELNNSYKANAKKVPFPENSSSDVTDPLISAVQPMPAKRIRKISKKDLKTSKTFGAAVLRSCNPKLTLSQINKKETDLNDASASSAVENIEEPSDEVENALEKTSRKKLKRSALKMLPQSHKILKGFKDKSKLKAKIKTTAKLFPLFLKSPVVLAKKKSIERMNLIAKKRIEGNVDVKLLDTISNITTMNTIKKRERPKKVQSSCMSPKENVTEIGEKGDEFSNELVEMDSKSNISEVDEKVRRKSERTKKEPNSVPLESSTVVKGMLPNESIEICSLSDVSKENKNVKRRHGTMQSSVLKNLPENEEMPKDLTNEVIELDAESLNMCVESKIKHKSQRKVCISASSQEKTEVLPNEKIETDVVSDNKTEEAGNARRKSLRQRKVLSYSSPTEMEEVSKELSTDKVKELKQLKKKSITSAQPKKVIGVAKSIGKTSKVLKSSSPKKSMNEIGKRPEKVLPAAKDIAESSDDSVEEISDPHILSTKDVKSEKHSNSTVSQNSMDGNAKKINHPKKIERNLSFPLYSHCFQIETPTETTNQCNFNYILKDEDASDVSIPEWSNIIGITEVKTIEHSNMLLNETEESSTKHLSDLSNPDEKSNSLWTNIANDYNLKEVVSESTISELTLWLKQWKSKFTKNAKHKRDKDDSFDSFSCDSNDSDADGLSNSVILMGPPGSGKTSLVFSLANEHGFKVLEVNASSCRSGRNISHQLKEALESYHVENLKSSDVNIQGEKEEVFRTSKSKLSNDVTSKKQTNKGIASFFQKDKSCSVNAKEVSKASNVKNFFQAKSSSSTKPPSKKSKLVTEDRSNSSNNQDVEASKDPNPYSISSHTIILFDDIDVVFQEDEGFWSTIRGFLKISKKPVIFTISRNLDIVKANLDIDIQILHLKPMISEIAIQKLQNQFKSHKRVNKSLNVDMLTANSNDVRRNLLHAQFWSQLASNQTVPMNEKFLNINTFCLGSLDCPTDLNYFVGETPSNSLNLIADYHKIGYDILHTNLFSMFNVNDGQVAERQWQIVTKRPEEEIQSDFDSKPDSTNGIPKSDLWQEACKIFEFKKRALKNGSSSRDLFLFSNILEDFSFVDTLKGHFCKNTNWISLPERIKKWTLGMPMCNDTNPDSPSNFTLDAISSIQVLRLKELHNSFSKQHELVHDKTKVLFLEHSFPNFDCTDGNKTENQVEIIASAVPANLSISKSILNLDYLSSLKIMCQDELLRQARTGKRSNRFLHYFDSISFLLDKQQIEEILQ